MPSIAPADQYDSPWKDALTEAFPEFIAFYFPHAHRQIDWSQEHVFLDKELRQLLTRRSNTSVRPEPFGLAQDRLVEGPSQGFDRLSPNGS